MQEGGPLRGAKRGQGLSVRWYRFQAVMGVAEKLRLVGRLMTTARVACLGSCSGATKCTYKSLGSHMARVLLYKSALLGGW